ncbi:MAG: response regulator [Sulfuricurvum sp.]|jgi:CheY-like chemotaxis protein
MFIGKGIHKFSHRLNILYVEDNHELRKETKTLFEPFFQSIDLAENGEEGLLKYNNGHYDIVITDINMPRMNGLDMIDHIREINPEQKIIVITAHDEQDTLISMIRKGVSSFILKPIVLEEMLSVMYPICRDADTHNMNAELFKELHEERNKFKQQVRLLEAQLHTISVKNQQVEHLYFQNKPAETDELFKEYFAKDEDQGYDKVIFGEEDADEMKELLSEIPNLLIRYCTENDVEKIHKITSYIVKLGNILRLYTPFMDLLAKSMEELAYAIAEGTAFIALIDSKPEMVLKLFDAVCIDMTLYIERFSMESMAMKNIHHIHQPTAISIQQITGLLNPEDVEDGDIEFF